MEQIAEVEKIVTEKYEGSGPVLVQTTKAPQPLGDTTGSGEGGRPGANPNEKAQAPAQNQPNQKALGDVTSSASRPETLDGAGTVNQGNVAGSGTMPSGTEQTRSNPLSSDRANQVMAALARAKSFGQQGKDADCMRAVSEARDLMGTNTK
jgi:hypothetical protein